MNKRIVEIRKRAGLNQDEFAERINISKNYVSLIENGKKKPSENLISKICTEFNEDKHWLLTGEHKIEKNKLSYYLGNIKNGNDDLIRDIIEVYMELDSDSKKALRKIADKMYKKRMEREQK